MLLERTVPDAAAKQWPEAPYKGLNYYTAKDAPLFAQRDKETEACAQIVGRYETKLLLLHGRSGTGKSSFLRAGLLPRLLEDAEHFTCLRTIANPNEPYLIRCTDDPIVRLRSTLLVALKADDSLQRRLPVAVRSQAILLLESTAERGALADALLKCLTLLTASLIGTLVLVIDQSEEVLTLASDGESTSRKSAFFSFLEDLCFERIDLKIVISLRTEYYGQFCDWFRISPSLAVTTKRVGMEQFMLHGLQDKDDLAAAIERPTVKRKVGQYRPPFEKYEFEYAPALVNRIAVDIVNHCGESSALPVMQVVCKDLYETVVGQQGRSKIEQSDYKKQGGVEGALDRFIDQSIKSAVDEVVGPPKDHEIEAWRDVIATLVARQEGGALTTLLSPKDDLIAFARSKGFKTCIVECLSKMADEKYRLLRKVSLVSAEHASVDHFSLGHDAIAASLFRWKEAREKLLEAQKRLSRFRIFGGLTIAALTAGVILVYAQSLIMRGAAVKATNAYTASEPLLDARIRLLLLMASWNESNGFARRLLPFNETRVELEKTLASSPMNMWSAEAVGLSGDGERVAFIRDNKIFIGGVYDKEAKELGTVGTPNAPPSAAQMNPWISIGFISGLSDPVAYRNGQFTFWASGEKKVIDLKNIINMSNLPRAPFVEIAGGAIRLTTFDQAGKLLFSDLRFDAATNSLAPDEDNEMRDIGVIWPTYSEFSSRLLVIQNAPEDRGRSTLVIATRNSKRRNTSVELSGPAKQPGSDGLGGISSQVSGQPAPQPYLRSIAFSNQDKSIVIRENSGTLLVFPLKDGEATEKVEIPVPEIAAAYGAPRPAFFTPRPLLASVQVGNERRIAWLSEKGVIFIRSEFGSRAPLLRWPPLLPSLSSLDSASKMRFSDDGEKLVLVQQRGAGQANVRVWNLSEARRLAITKMTNSALRREACRVASLEEHGNRFTQDEKASWLSVSGTQPCEGMQ
ncbi:hypothetical protein ACVWXQ_004249 [Bradyrhizobium sp. S3.14.4]